MPKGRNHIAMNNDGIVGLESINNDVGKILWSKQIENKNERHQHHPICFVRLGASSRAYHPFQYSKRL
jgi:hypothetical protein